MSNNEVPNLYAEFISKITEYKVQSNLSQDLWNNLIVLKEKIADKINNDLRLFLEVNLSILHNSSQDMLVLNFHQTVAQLEKEELLRIINYKPLGYYKFYKMVAKSNQHIEFTFEKMPLEERLSLRNVG